MATLGSHRVATDAPLVRLGAERAVVRCAMVHDGRELLVELEIVPGKANRARLGRSPAPRARDVLGRPAARCCSPRRTSRWSAATRPSAAATSTTCWSPGSPATPGVRADYERVLKQRNALLRTAYLARKTGGSGAATCRHPRRLGHPPGRSTARSCSPAGWSWSPRSRPHVAKAYDAVAAGSEAGGIAYRSRSIGAGRAGHRPGRR